MLEVIQAIITALGSAITLFVLSKLMGNREMSQLSVFDYINSITIGSIAAEMATGEFTDILKPFVAMIVFAVLTIILSLLTNKSVKLRRLITGRPSILYDKGQLYYKNLSKAKMDLGEFLTQCRVSGYFDLSNIQTAILESNGKISFLPISNMRPVTGKDLNIHPEQEQLVANVIIDGKIMPLNLKHLGLDEKWLSKQLKLHDIHAVSEVFLATCDSNHKLCVYKKLNEEMTIDILE